VSDQTYFSVSRSLLYAVSPRSANRKRSARASGISIPDVNRKKKALPLASSERSDLDLAHCCLHLPRDQSSEEKHLSSWYLHPRYQSEGGRGLPTRPGHSAWATRPDYLFPASKEGRRGQVSFFLRRWRPGLRDQVSFFPASMRRRLGLLHQDCLANTAGACFFPLLIAQTKTAGCHEHPTAHNAPRQKAARPRRVT
jgi:hypothetical protein